MDVDLIEVRVVEYEPPNRDGRTEFIRLITTILDPVETSAAELAAVYHERWEEESVFGEIETDLRGGADVVLRSRHAETVRQEIWALLLTHYAVRHLMCEAAEQTDVDVDRLSFVRSFRAVRRQVVDQAAFSQVRLAGRCGRRWRRYFSVVTRARGNGVVPVRLRRPGIAIKKRRSDYAGVRLRGPALVVVRSPEPYVLAISPTLPRETLSKWHCPWEWVGAELSGVRSDRRLAAR